MPPLSYTWNLRSGTAKVDAGRATVVDEVDARHTVLRAEQAVLDVCPRLAGARIDLLRLLAALEIDG